MRRFKFRDVRNDFVEYCKQINAFEGKKNITSKDYLDVLYKFLCERKDTAEFLKEKCIGKNTFLNILKERGLHYKENFVKGNAVCIGGGFGYIHLCIKNNVKKDVMPFNVKIVHSRKSEENGIKFIKPKSYGYILLPSYVVYKKAFDNARKNPFLF